MKSNLLKKLAIFTISLIGILAFSFTPVYADVCSEEVRYEIKQAAGCYDNQDSVSDVAVSIINWVMGIIGLVCVVVIIIGGIQYMTSTGDAGKVKRAKDTILYAVIGLIVVALAAIIVNFVIKKLVS